MPSKKVIDQLAEEFLSKEPKAPNPGFSMINKGGVYIATCTAGELTGVKIRVDRLDEDKKALTGEWDIQWPGVRSDITLSRINLLTAQGRNSLARYCNDFIPSPAWAGLIEAVSRAIVKAHREGEPFILTAEAPEIHKVEYALYPFLIKNAPNVIFGDGGIGKSILALWMATLVQEGCPQGDIFPNDPGQVLVLDYEEDAPIARMRVDAIYRGLDLEVGSSMLYRRCYRPLIDDIERYQQVVAECDVKLVVVDSAVYACGGEPESAEATSKFFLALRTLGVTSLINAHKNNAGDDRPFGSVQWRNSPRTMWAMKKTQEPGDNTLSAMLQDKKRNYSGQQRPRCFQVDFNEDDRSIVVQKVDAQDIPEFEVDLPSIERIVAALERGKQATSWLAKELDMKRDTVYKTCARYEGKRVVKVGTNLGDVEWGLIARPR